MTGIVVLDVVIGLVFVYLIYSLFATILQEIIATNFGFRAKILERAIMRMLEDKDYFNLRIKGFFRLIFGKDISKTDAKLTNEFYNHPLVKFLGEGNMHKKPSSLRKESFSKVIIDLLRGEINKPGDNISDLIQNAFDSNSTNWGNTAIGNQTLKYLKSIWADAQGDVEKFKELLENWFDETMERTIGWYKKYTQVFLLIIGFILAFSFNVDTFKIVEKLQKDPKLREQIIQQANGFLETHPNLEAVLAKDSILNQKLVYSNLKSNAQQIDTINAAKKLKQLDSINTANYHFLIHRRDSLMKMAKSILDNDLSKINGTLGLGRGTNDDCAKEPNCYKRFCCFLKSLLGWLITAIAISLGAPFWFDTLNKLMKLRNSLVSANTTVSAKESDDKNVKSVKRKG